MREQPRSWIALDYDKVEIPPDVDHNDLVAVAKWLVDHHAPKAFRGVLGIVQATGSYKVKPGARVRLWFWLSRPLGKCELTAWFKKYPAADQSVFRTIEPIFTASPHFQEPMVDPMEGRRRYAWIPGDVDTVQVPEKLPVPEKKIKASPSGVSVPPVTTADQMREILLTIGMAANGARNNTLFSGACRFGEAVACGILTEYEAICLLVDAAELAGLERDQAEATARSGLRTGIQNDPFEKARNQFAADMLSEEM